MSGPLRPRLADWVLPRMHVVDGVDTLVLHDTRTQRIVRLEARFWDVLACADGTRDFDAILLASARKGAYRRASEIRALFEQLEQATLLSDGIDTLREPAETPRETPAGRPIDPLPGYTLTCDRSGRCCGQYASIRFTVPETLRARVFVPEVFAGREDHVFLPLAGSVEGASSAVALVDGRCAYLADDGACRIHGVAGAHAKPLACRLHPATFVDDGVSVRVSIAIECGCVLASVGVEGGQSLVPEGAPTRGALDHEVNVGTLPASVPITTSRAAPREDIAHWSRALFDRTTNDAPGALVALADAIEHAGASIEAATRAFDAPAELGALTRYFAPLATATAQTADSAEAWRSARDGARVGRRLVAEAAARLAREGPVHDAHGRDESFYLRATLFGHHALLQGLPLADALRERALRILVARALQAEHPLAIVEATLRGVRG
jgi:lysine-N-methylase